MQALKSNDGSHCLILDQKRPEIKPVPTVPVAPPSAPEINPQPDRHIPQPIPSPEITPAPLPEVQPQK